MALLSMQHEPKYLQGIVDMGSNGIRFSISSLQPPAARIMPTLYQHRAGISLYDAQYTTSGQRQPISDETIKAVITTFKQFKQTCEDFGVLDNNITVLATEATRTAINSEDFRRQIRDAVGWEVTMLAKEEEGRVGAMGIASSLPEISGLVMDLGGGSTQLSWLMSDGRGKVQMPPSGAVSMPYGAAAMSRRLDEAEKAGSVEKLKTEVQDAIKDAYATLHVPNKLKESAAKQGGFTLYLSGGGFRGWGYVLMSRHSVHPYPIPVINGFKISRQQFMGIEEIKTAAATALANEDDEIFRVSDRRASQVPAVAFLVNALAKALPEIKQVRFCQGGVREGYLYTTLDAEVQESNPLVVATKAFSPASPESALELLHAALPRGTTEDGHEAVFTTEILEAFASMMYCHSSHSKDLQASAALRSTTSGVLAGVHGLLHEHRTLLALLLCARWGGEVPPIDEAFKRSLERLIESPWTLWWINYIACVAALIGAVYPAGVNDFGRKKRIVLSAQWMKGEKSTVYIQFGVKLAVESEPDMVAKEIKAIEKVGKKKNWIGGRDGFGHKVVVETSSVPG